MAFEVFDVIVIGGGIIGCSVARELSRFNLKIALLEKDEDVAVATSKANSGIVHAGFDAKPGSLKARYNIEGNRMFDALSAELDFPFSRNGAMVLCFEGEDLHKLDELYEKGVTNGIKDLKVLTKSEIKKLEPNINDKAAAALYAPSSGIVGPYEMTLAYAENAAANGVEFNFMKEVVSIKRKDGNFEIRCADGTIFRSKTIVNAAGCNSDDINNMVSPFALKIIPRKGEYCLFDKALEGVIKHTLFQLPSAFGKGVLVTPTVHGNLMIGPNAVDIDDKYNRNTTAEGLNEIFEKSQKSVPSITKRDIITQFAGLRAHLESDDFVIGETEHGFFNAAGIESPGLTSAPAIAKDLAEKIAVKLKADINRNFSGQRKGIPEFNLLTPEQRQELIKANAQYGRIVCRCENVTEGEIVEAIRRKPGARSLDGVKRRTRAGMGRCQSGFCSPRVLEILARELNLPLTSVTKSGGNSEILLYRNKADTNKLEQKDDRASAYKEKEQ